MRLLLDSHVLIWALDQPVQLSEPAAAALINNANDILLSAATIWELAIKCSLGKLSLSSPYGHWISQAIIDLDLSILPITVPHADAQIALPHHHRDPFDRMLIAQAMVEQIPIVSGDAVFDQYRVRRLWQ